ncbi:DMT family transporter [Bacteroidota bacterium]
MPSYRNTRIIPILQALFVTLLWSSSFIIIKIGLDEIPPILFAGLRYIIAFLFLLPLLLKKSRIVEIRNIEKKDWIKLVLLGLIFYTFTQGSQFLGLSLLPSVTVSLLLNFTPIVVAFMGIYLINEYPTGIQWIGTILFIFGILTYFLPISSSSNAVTSLYV